MPATDYNQTFDGFTDGSVSGQDGWDDVSSKFIIQSSVVYLGAKAVHIQPGTISYTSNRTVSSWDSGEEYVAFRTDALPAGGTGVAIYLRSSGAYRGLVRVEGSNIVAYGSGGGETLATGISTDTWYVIGFKFLSSTTFQANINNGSWSSTLTMSSTFNQIQMSAGDDVNNYPNVYFDEWRTTFPSPPTPSVTIPNSNLLLMGVG